MLVLIHDALHLINLVPIGGENGSCLAGNTHWACHSDQREDNEPGLGKVGALRILLRIIVHEDLPVNVWTGEWRRKMVTICAILSGRG